MISPNQLCSSASYFTLNLKIPIKSRLQHSSFWDLLVVCERLCYKSCAYLTDLKVGTFAFCKGCLDTQNSVFITIFLVTRLACNSPLADLYTDVTCFILMYEKKQCGSVLFWKKYPANFWNAITLFLFTSFNTLKRKSFLLGFVAFILNGKRFLLVMLTSIKQLDWRVCPNHWILWSILIFSGTNRQSWSLLEIGSLEYLNCSSGEWLEKQDWWRKIVFVI